MQNDIEKEIQELRRAGVAAQISMFVAVVGTIAFMILFAIWTSPSCDRGLLLADCEKESPWLLRR